MQGGSQVLRSTQKRLEDVKHISEAIAAGTSILMDQEERQIIQQAALLGEDGEAMIEEVLDRAREVAIQPADVLRQVEGCLRKLSKKAALRELSVDLEKEMERERTAQLKVMELEAEKLRAASKKGDMAGLSRGYGALKGQLEAYLSELVVDMDGEKVSLDPLGTWRRAAMGLT
jgi:hypothetical protein